MTSSPATVIRKLLLDLGLVTADSDWKAWVSFMPEDPNEAVCIYDTAGKPDGRMMLTGERVEHPGIMVHVRGGQFPATWNKVFAIAQALDAVRMAEVSLSATEQYTVRNVSRSGTIMPLGVEEEGSRRRYDFTINAVLTLEQT